MTPRTLRNGHRGHDGNLHNMIFLSLTVHLVAITVLLVAIPTTSRHMTFGTTYSVQLVSSEVVLPKPDSSGVQDLLKASQEISPIIIKKKITDIHSAEVNKRDVNNSPVEKAINAIRQKQQNVQGKSATASAAGEARISESEINAQTSEYIGVVWSRVKQNWTMPQALMPKENITAIIDVRIGRSGALEYAGFEKRSGNRYFDESALRAVKKSSPFQPLPHWVMDQSIEIGIRFHSAELR